MTCIAAVSEGERVWIGGDSAGAKDWSIAIRADEKVFCNGPFIMGFTSSFRMGQLLRYAFTPPDLPSNDDMDRYMVTVFVDAVRQCLKTGGLAQVKDQVEAGGIFIVGVRGSLYVIESDYQVGKYADGYAAVGCGADIALGSLFTSRGQPPDSRIRKALEAAEAHSSGVRGPFVIKHTGLIALEASA